MIRLLKKLFRNKKGQGLVEYGLIIAGVALICAVAVSVFGHKTSDLWAAVTVVLPGAHTDDNNPISSGHLMETTVNSKGAIDLDLAGIKTNSGTARLGVNTEGDSVNGFDGLIVETGP